MIRVLRSTSVRLALAYAAVFTASAVALMAFVWWKTVVPLEREFDAAIRAEAAAFAARLGVLAGAEAAGFVDGRVRDGLDEDAVLVLADARGQRLAGNLPSWPVEADGPGWRELAVARDGAPVPVRALHLALPDGRHLLVGRAVEDLAALRGTLVESLLGAAGMTLVLGFVGGALLRRALLVRIGAIAGTARAIVAGDLARRVPTRGSDDEFDLLAGTVNRLLAQIEQLVEGTRSITNAIAHDLRTPLTELRTRLEELLRERPDPEAVYARVEAAVGDVDRLIGLFNALLRLAELDSGVRRSGFVAVDLVRVATDVVELYEPLAEARGMALTLEAPAVLPVTGDPALLAQALANLVDNAVKYTPEGGAIRVGLARDGGGAATAMVADDGPGIPDHEKDRVLERFYRSDGSRGTAGSGLGLNLVAAVARLHDGTLTLADNHPGLRAVLRLPGAR